MTYDLMTYGLWYRWRRKTPRRQRARWGFGSKTLKVPEDLNSYFSGDRRDCVSSYQYSGMRMLAVLVRRRDREILHRESGKWTIADTWTMQNVWRSLIV